MTDNLFFFLSVFSVSIPPTQHEVSITGTKLRNCFFPALHTNHYKFRKPASLREETQEALPMFRENCLEMWHSECLRYESVVSHLSGKLSQDCSQSVKHICAICQGSRGLTPKTHQGKCQFTLLSTLNTFPSLSSEFPLLCATIGCNYGTVICAFDSKY